MYLAMKKGQYSAVAANAKVLMRLIGLDQQHVNHNVGFKHGSQMLLQRHKWIIQFLVGERKVLDIPNGSDSILLASELKQIKSKKDFKKT